MKHNLISYWNLYHAPVKRTVFLIVVVFALQWCAHICVRVNLVEIFQQKQMIVALPLLS